MFLQSAAMESHTLCLYTFTGSKRDVNGVQPLTRYFRFALRGLFEQPYAIYIAPSSTGITFLIFHYDAL